MRSAEQKMLNNLDCHDFDAETVGEATIPSPTPTCIAEDSKVLYLQDYESTQQVLKEGRDLPAFERAGPRDTIFHDPAWTRAAIVSCGGLCPGLNDVIKGLVNTLHFSYGVKNIYGIPYGYKGFIPKYGFTPIMLTPDMVDTIHEEGGTILGSSRGQQSTPEIVDTLQRCNINVLFCIGGDGTLRAAREIAEECTERKLAISVIGIPKTIDNDLAFMDRTFGFESAVYATGDVITSAHMEAKGTYNGIGLVKLMGRDSGFIAAYASLANSVVNYCLIPEMEVKLEGEGGLLEALRKRFEISKRHAVIVVAEGAGQNLFDGAEKRYDASGNLLKNDIGLLLKERIGSYFKEQGIDHSIKYFDPSYSIRSIPAQGTDAIFCYLLAENAVHAGMSGRTNIVIGHWGGSFTHVPIRLATMERRKLDVHSGLWKAVMSATRQVY